MDLRRLPRPPTVGTSVVTGTIPIEDGETKPGERGLTGSGELKFTTTPGMLVKCGKPVVSGDGAVRGYVLSATVGATSAETTVQFAFNSATEISEYTLPSCEPFAQMTYSAAFWGPGFAAGHADEGSATGFAIRDWEFTGDDLTNGGILATRKYTETCHVGCTGTSTFRLRLTPIPEP